MKILLAIALLASTAFAQQFTVQSPITVVCPQGPATASGATFTCPGGVVPQCPSPPGPGPCGVPVGTVFVGDLQFTGVQLDTGGITSSTKCGYGRITIPAGHVGLTSSVVIFANGSSNAWRQTTLSKIPCDFSQTSAPYFSQGQTSNLFLAFTTPRVNAVTVLPAEVWYFNFRQQLPFGGGSSCTIPDCNAGIRMYPPS